MTPGKISRLLLKIIGTVLMLISIYSIAAFSLPYIPVNSDFEQCKKDAIEIYILTNGVHTDIVCPLKNEYKDWSKFVNPADTKQPDTLANLVAFGWGDKGFYLETKTWADLKFKTAFKALFYLGSSAMHVSFYRQLRESESCRKICITRENYAKLVDYIAHSFDPDGTGNPLQIKGASYQENDAFYEATRTYSFFYTCNTWANDGLKSAGLKACFWTPFKNGIFNKYSE